MMQFHKGKRKYDPILGWIMKPNVTSDDLNTDARGLRLNGQKTLQRKPGEMILVTGDSFSQGSNVREEETWPAVLEQLSGFSVANAAIGGWGMPHPPMAALATENPDSCSSTAGQVSSSRTLDPWLNESPVTRIISPGLRCSVFWPFNLNPRASVFKSSDVTLGFIIQPKIGSYFRFPLWNCIISTLVVAKFRNSRRPTSSCVRRIVTSAPM